MTEESIDPHWEVFAVGMHSALCVICATCGFFHWLKKHPGHAGIFVGILLYSGFSLHRHGKRVLGGANDGRE